MSTFNGIVKEFPQIRIDHFRKNPEKPPPLACFLSHVHSDHLQGLESLRGPFVYCSTATREILLRIEKYPHRMNFSKGILESRKQHYKHLTKLLRPIPLQVPTEMELMPGNRIRVTLFDANHCPGAVMFLIEGNGKSILYTGDIRAETWWIDSLVRNPILIPYTLGNKRLDNLYMDTTFAVRSDIYATFPSKAEGIRELIEIAQQYPDDTIFYLRSWTFGYEEVWLALSNALKSPIHVDRYRLGLYKSLAAHANRGFGSNDGLYLCGFTLGNAHTRGCLTDKQSARIHSCEPGDVCPAISSGRPVYITPIVTRAQDGSDILEVGAGGWIGGSYQTNELEIPDDTAVQQLVDLCAEHIPNPTTQTAIATTLLDAYASKSKSLPLDDYGVKGEDEISLTKLVQMLSRRPTKPISHPNEQTATQEKLPGTIRFPYSRHSSYEELCSLVKAFKPKDIVPCTVDAGSWREEVSMEYLFGPLCSSTTFLHDQMMREMIQDPDSRPRKRKRCDSDSSVAQSTQQSSLDIVAEQAHSVPSSPSSARATYTASTGGGEYINTRDTNTTNPTQTDSTQISQSKRKIHDQEIDFHPTIPGPSEVAAESQLSLQTTPGRNDTQSLPQYSSTKSNPPPQFSPSPPTPPPNASFEHDIEEDENDTENDTESIISLSPSAFDSQPTAAATTTTTTAVQGRRHIDDLELDVSLDSNPLTPSSAPSCRSKRMAAYRAARSGSFELWSSFYSPVTAGNNHSEADAEL